MTHSTTETGKCLCGAVTIEATKMSNEVGACHCSMCRKWGGGPLLAVDCQDAVSFGGEESIATYQSSEWAERGFCKQCGTHLFYRLKLNGHFIVPADLFDTDNDLLFDHQIFIDEKPKYYDFANDTKTMTGEEVFAQFSTD